MLSDDYRNFNDYIRNIRKRDIKDGLLGIAGAVAFGSLFGVLGYYGIQSHESRSSFIGMIIFTEVVAGVVLYQAAWSVVDALKNLNREKIQGRSQGKQEEKEKSENEKGLEKKI